MKDNKILLLIPLTLLFILTIIMGIILYDNNTTRKANEKLKKEKYEIKQKCEKLEDENLKLIIGGN